MCLLPRAALHSDSEQYIPRDTYPFPAHSLHSYLSQSATWESYPFPTLYAAWDSYAFLITLHSPRLLLFPLNTLHSSGLLPIPSNLHYLGTLTLLGTLHTLPKTHIHSHQTDSNSWDSYLFSALYTLQLLPIYIQQCTLPGAPKQFPAIYTPST